MISGLCRALSRVCLGVSFCFCKTSQNVNIRRCGQPQIWPLWWRISLSIRVQTTLNLIRFAFYHNINVKRACPRAWHIDANSVVWTRIDYGKLANQIARLAAIVVNIMMWNKSRVDPQTALTMLWWDSLSTPGQTHEKLTSPQLCTTHTHTMHLCRVICAKIASKRVGERLER